MSVVLRVGCDKVTRTLLTRLLHWWIVLLNGHLEVVRVRFGVIGIQSLRLGVRLHGSSLRLGHHRNECAVDFRRGLGRYAWFGNSSVAGDDRSRLWVVRCDDHIRRPRPGQRGGRAWKLLESDSELVTVEYRVRTTVRMTLEVEEPDSEVADGVVAVE